MCQEEGNQVEEKHKEARQHTRREKPSRALVAGTCTAGRADTLENRATTAEAGTT